MHLGVDEHRRHRPSLYQHIVRGYRYAVLPNSWKNRKKGISKVRIKEIGSRYLFIILYCWLERMLSRGDYRDQQRFRESQLQVWYR
jgi:dolichol-phosphate mannosyltransferase